MKWREAISAEKGDRNGVLEGGRWKRAAEEIAFFIAPPPDVPPRRQQGSYKNPRGVGVMPPRQKKGGRNDVLGQGRWKRSAE